MAPYASKYIPGNAEADGNRESMLALIETFRSYESKVRANSQSKATRFHERGQLLPRERINLLLDPGRPYLELSSLAGLKMHDDDGADSAMGGGSIAGIGYVSGVRCLVVANDSAIKGGSISPMGLRKTLRAQEIALENKLPVVSLVESGGANLEHQSEIFVDGGKIFCNMARLSAAGIPQVTVVHGSSTAGGAYLPGLSDYVVVVRNKAKIFLAGPPLLKAATGEVATDEELGGAHMHATVAGTAEYLAEDDAHGVQIARQIMSHLHWPDYQEPNDFTEPLYSGDDLVGLVPTDYRKPYDVREVMARLVDGSDFLDFKNNYGIPIVCAHGSIGGHKVGLIGNNGPIDVDASVKAAQFIQLCCQTDMPIIYLQNITGYMVGVEAERGGIVKHGAKMIQAVANASVPQLTVVLGGSFGAGNYGMCGRGFDPRFIFSWPNARTAVMGGEQAAKVMEIITTAKLERKGMSPDPEFLKGMSDHIINQVDKQSTATFSTARLWDDGIIDPRDTRKVLAYCLSICRDAQERELHPNSFGVGRM